MEAWRTHKRVLRKKFKWLMDEVKSQLRRHETEAVQPDGTDNSQSNDFDETLLSNAPTISHRPVHRPFAEIVASTREPLGLPLGMSVADALGRSISALGLENGGAMTLMDKALRVAHEMNIDTSADPEEAWR